MRLTDLNAELRKIRHPKDQALTVPEAYGLHFRCPCGQHDIWAPFQHACKSEPAWCATGTTLEDLSFVDSPRGSRSVRCNTPCKAHFNITSGAIEFYDDSGFKA